MKNKCTYWRGGESQSSHASTAAHWSCFIPFHTRNRTHTQVWIKLSFALPTMTSSSRSRSRCSSRNGPGVPKYAVQFHGERWAITAIVHDRDDAPRAAAEHLVAYGRACESVLRRCQATGLDDETCTAALDDFKRKRAQHFRGCYADLLDGILSSIRRAAPLSDAEPQQASSSPETRPVLWSREMTEAWATLEELVRDADIPRGRWAQPLTSLPAWTPRQQGLCFSHLRKVLAGWRRVRSNHIEGSAVVLSSCLDG